jgi:uncharacterized protein involved in exopolysaccharide biosynthesis
VLVSVLLSVLRRKWLVIATFVVISGAASVFIVVQPPSYLARSTLLAKFGREYAVQSADGKDVASNVAMDDIVNSTVELLKSESIATLTLKKAGARKLYPELFKSKGSIAEAILAIKKIVDPDIDRVQETPEQAALEKLMKSIKVASSRASNIIIVDFDYTDPNVAAETLNDYVDAFLVRYVALYGERNEGFYADRAARAARDLDAAQSELTTFEQAHRTYDGDRQLAAMTERHSQMEAQRADLASCCADSPGLLDLVQRESELERQITMFNADQATTKTLARRRDLAQEMFDTATRRAQDARLARGMDDDRITSVVIIDPATPPASASKPTRSIKIIMAVIVAAIASVLFALLAEALRRRFSTGRQLSNVVDVPILAEVPRYDIRKLGVHS